MKVARFVAFSIVCGSLAAAGEAGARKPREYRISIRGSDQWSDARSLAKTLADAKARLQKYGAPYRIKVRGPDTWSFPRNLAGTMERLEARLRGREIGDMILVEAKKQILRVRIVQRAAIIADTVGTAKIDRLHGELWRRFPDLESWGICNCRKIAGSTSWSQHSWCHAEDLHRVAGGSVKKGLDPVYKWLVANKARLQIERVLWQVPDHFDHIHVDMSPNFTGTPPCAR